MVKQMHNWRR